MGKRKNAVFSARQAALCGILAALALVIMLLGGLIPLATFCCPVLAGVLLVPVQERCGNRIALAWYGTVSLLACLLGPDKEAAAVFVFLGYYPVLQQVLDRWPKALGLLGRLLLFNGAICILYGLLIFVFTMPDVAAEFRSTSYWMLAAMLVLGNIVFLLFDQVLRRIRRLWRRKWMR